MSISVMDSESNVILLTNDIYVSGVTEIGATSPYKETGWRSSDTPLQLSKRA